MNDIPNGPMEKVLPLFKCHKDVLAAKITGVTPMTEAGVTSLMLGGSGNVQVSKDFIAKHAPSVGGYYVVYQDGYESYSPAKAFEEGYTLANVPSEGEESQASAPSLVVVGDSSIEKIVIMSKDLQNGLMYAVSAIEVHGGCIVKHETHAPNGNCMATCFVPGVKLTANPKGGYTITGR